MDHASIARVLDAGTTEAGRPYFVMDLVRGVPITRYCDEHHLTPRQRLELFIPVCQAIQHAHQKGIIHRDLKPSNVLVALYDGKPVPKVIDFGVAKAAGKSLTEKTLVTGFGNIVGTLEYMSPEQAEVNQLDIDTRSDIYSLGVLLYELLTGSPPFSRKELENAGMLEMLRVIREDEPSKPSTKLSTAEGLPTLAANRGTEPAKLAKLVRGELDWIVMKALEKDRNRRYETANGFAMDVQRYLADEPVQACPPSAAYRLRKFVRRNKFNLATAGLVLCFVVILGALIGWGVWDRAARERAAAQDAARKRALTEHSIRQALERAVASRTELHSLLKKPGGVQELLNQPARWELFLKTAQGELAQARRLMAQAEGDLDAELTRRADQVEQHLASDQADYDLVLLLERMSQDERILLVNSEFDHPSVSAEYEKVFARFGPFNGDPGPTASRVSSSPIREQLVAALDRWAFVAMHLEKSDLEQRVWAVARRAAPDPVWGDRIRQLGAWKDQKALEALVRQAPSTGVSPQLRAEVGERLRVLHSPLAEPFLRRAQAEHPADFWLNFNLGHTLSDTNPAEAIGFYRAALAIRPENSMVYNNLGAALDNLKKTPEAEAAFRRAIELNPQNAGMPYYNLGRMLKDQGKTADAIDAYNRSLALSPKDWYGYGNLGMALADQNRLPEAIAAYRKALEINPKSAVDLTNLGVALYGHGQTDEATAAYRESIRLRPNDANTYFNLNLALYQKGRLAEAADACRKAIELDPTRADAHNSLGIALKDLGNREEAIASYRQAIELDPKYFKASLNLGLELSERGDLDEAIKVLHTAVELAPQAAAPLPHLAELLSTYPDPTIRDLARAVEYAKRATELEPQSSEAWQILGWTQYRAGGWSESIEALEKSCQLQADGTGDAGQWIVLALAHAKLGADANMPEQQRAQHQQEARHRFDQSDTQIDQWWPAQPGHRMGKAIWEFRQEARALLGVAEPKK
jgi:tetratricopeptide (TPR) repeat protein